MTHSYQRIYVHFVWHTKYAEPLLEGRLESFAIDQIRETVEEYGLVTAAVNAAWDHVHVLVGWETGVELETFVQTAKGRTAYRWNQNERRENEPELEWQTGYGAVSVSPDRVDRVVGYVDAQKRRHRESDVIRRYERVEV